MDDLQSLNLNDEISVNNIIKSIIESDSSKLKDKVSNLLNTISQQSKLLKLASLQSFNNNTINNKQNIESNLSSCSSTNITTPTIFDYSSPPEKLRRKSITSTLSVPSVNDDRLSNNLSDLIIPKSPILYGSLPMSRGTLRNKNSASGKSSSFHPLFTTSSETFLSLHPSPNYDTTSPYFNINSIQNASSSASCYVKILQTIFELYPNVCSAGIYRLHPINSSNNSKSPKITKDNNLVWRSIAYRSPETSNIHFKKKLINLASGVGLASRCADSQSTLNVSNINENEFFSKEIDAPLVKVNSTSINKSGFTAAFQNVLHAYSENTYRALCVPVLNANQKFIADI